MRMGGKGVSVVLLETSIKGDLHRFWTVPTYSNRLANMLFNCLQCPNCYLIPQELGVHLKDKTHRSG